VQHLNPEKMMMRKQGRLSASPTRRGNGPLAIGKMMFDRQCRSAFSVLLTLTIVGAPLTHSVRAQSQSPSAQLQSASPPSAAAPKPATRTELFKEFSKIDAVTDQDERMKLLIGMLEDRPELARLEDGGANVAFDANEYIKVNAADPRKLEQWYVVFVPLVQKALAGPSYEASEFEYLLANYLQGSNVLLAQAAQLAQQAVQDCHEDDVLARERTFVAWERERNKTPQAKSPADDEDIEAESLLRSDASEHFHRALAARYSLLARLQIKTGQDKAALESFEHSLSLHPDMRAYLGEATLQEQHGDKQQALTLLFDAYLTGHLGAVDIEHMRSLYGELHPGSSDGQLNALLDARYGATFNNPVKYSIYPQGTSAPSRKVLAELFTGAACEPCISPDLAFDAALKRYTRDELVLLVYHDNAPLADPLANPVAKERGKYYSTGGSTPHVFLDGKKIDLPEGLQSHAQQSADRLFAGVDQGLVGTTDAHVKVQAVRHGNRVEVTAHVQAPGGNCRKLHIDLIEEELSYSGENGLRFQPMVVRATAQRSEAGSGFDIPAGGLLDVRYTFDLSQIEAANNAYYDRFAEELKTRTHGIVTVNYREKKAAIDPTRLAVAAFVQDDGDKHVLQSAFSEVLERSQPLADGK
jgi:hypothetical protein